MLDENQALRDQLRYFRERDRLTGLWNKDTFCQKAAQLLARDPGPFDVVCVDVERFKLINDLYGIERGDHLLQYLARELQTAFADRQALLARLSNDVFCLCLPGGQEAYVEEQVLSIFQRYPLDVTVTPAIGVYHVEDPSIPVSFMCDWAVMALNSIKGNYLTHLAVYDEGLRSLLLEEQEIRNSADAALEHREFRVYLQPKVNIYTGKVVGAEALVRWLHPQRGLIPPINFIPIFERNGFIKKLDAYVWEETAAWLRRWIDAGHKALPVSVNLSRIDVFGMDVVGVLESLLTKYRLEPSLLELEITESAYVNQPEEIISTIDRLMGHGFTVLMDDFGSGYSSLNMLKDINVDVLKIDMRFLDRDNQKSKDILESVVHMGKWLDLPVIAEGVQTQNQVDFLRGIGCLYAQGYFYYRPMPLKDYEALLLQNERVDYEDGGKLQIAQESLLDLRDLFHKDAMSDRLLGNILGAIALYAYDGTHLFLSRANELYYRLTGRKEGPPNAEVDLFPAVYEEDRPALHDALHRAKEDDRENGVEVQVRQRRANGEMRWRRLQLFHLSCKGGRDLFYASLHDVTEQMEAVERLRISEQRLRLAMEATNIILFDLDLDSRVARYSKYAQRTFGLDATVANAPEGFIEQGTICDESVEDFRAVYREIYQGKERASAIIRARLADGSTAWNRITLTTVKDQWGHAAQALGMVETVARGEGPKPLP